MKPHIYFRAGFWRVGNLPFIVTPRTLELWAAARKWCGEHNSSEQAQRAL